jgi:hypothetical protein
MSDKINWELLATAMVEALREDLEMTLNGYGSKDLNGKRYKPDIMTLACAVDKLQKLMPDDWGPTK